MNILTIKQGEWLNKDHTHFRVVGTTDLPGFENQEIELFLTTEDEEYKKLSEELKSLIVDKVVPLATLIEEKHEELRFAMYEARNNAYVEYDNDEFDCNESAQLNMNTLVGLNLKTTQVRSRKEVTHTFTKEQLNELAGLMVLHINELYAKYWELKDALYKCSTEEELDNIKW